jgi:4-hydroxybenzoate polyprenyltransferase
MVLLDYTRDRLLRAPVLASGLLVTAGAQIGRGVTSAAAAAADLTISLCCVFAFRIWDDVMDRERDRVRHPERLAIAPGSVAALSIAASCLALAATGALLRVHGIAPVALLIAFTGLLAAWYTLRTARTAAGDRILLLKYAIFTLALTGPAPFRPRAVVVALGVYLTACVYEWRHDPESPVFSLGGSR